MENSNDTFLMIYKLDRCPKYDGWLKQTVEIRVDQIVQKSCYSTFFWKRKNKVPKSRNFYGSKIIEELRLFSNIIFKHYLKLFYSFFVGLKEFLHRHITKGGNCTGECIEQMKQKMKFDITSSTSNQRGFPVVTSRWSCHSTPFVKNSIVLWWPLH